MSTPPLNAEDFRRRAQRRLPRAVFDFVDGGAEDEVTVRANVADLDALRLVPRVADGAPPGVSPLATTLCDQPLALPLLLAPAGLAGMVHPDAEAGVGAAAARHGLAMVLSGAASSTMAEVVAAIGPGAPRPWYQLYLWRDRSYYGALIDRAAALGFGGLVVTVDTNAKGRKERDLRNGMSIPPRLTLANAVDTLRRPAWVAGVVRHRRVVVKAFDDDPRPPLRSLVARAAGSADLVTDQMVPATWAELEWIRARWPAPLAVKGILHPHDARRAVAMGADVVMVSNHGGRQLDGVQSTIGALGGVVDAVGPHAQVVMDGGIRRGTHILKALSLGARACMIGRPWVFALAAGGEAGVDRLLAGLRDELATALTLLGAGTLERLDRSYVAGCGVGDTRLS